MYLGFRFFVSYETLVYFFSKLQIKIPAAYAAGIVKVLTWIRMLR